ncbi:hypothetical protein MASR1M101_00240 [Gemmatimonas sp.]
MPFTEANVAEALAAVHGSGTPATATAIAAHVRQALPRANGQPVSHNDVTAVRRILVQLMDRHQAACTGVVEIETGRRPKVFAPVPPPA